MCTWAVVETINYFIRNDSEVFGCSMDKSKAFDLCKFSILFRKMFKKLSHIFLRLIIFIYVHQFSNISWNFQISSSFTIGNGVGQGKILAGYAYCFYCFEFFNILKKSGHGCTINGVYAGAFGYSDDDILLAPSLTSLEIMLGIAKDFNTSHGLKFSTNPNPMTSKTKCIAWLKKPRELLKLEICGNLLPWVDKVHLAMIQSIRTKPILNMILSAVEYDARSVTGRNLRTIMMELGKYEVSSLNISDCDNINVTQLKKMTSGGLR